jgi:hypothetical protein
MLMLQFTDSGWIIKVILKCDPYLDPEPIKYFRVMAAKDIEFV